MARIYARMILFGRITIDDVPEHWRKTVEELLEDLMAGVDR